jgi:hypothetical protein
MACKRRRDEIPSIIAGKEPIEPLLLSPDVLQNAFWQINVSSQMFAWTGRSWDLPNVVKYIPDKALTGIERLFLTTLAASKDNNEEDSFSIDHSVENPVTTADEKLAFKMLSKAREIYSDYDDGEEDAKAEPEPELDPVKFPMVVVGSVWIRYYGYPKRSKTDSPQEQEAKLPKLEPST